jgi:hypothetical protein
MSEYQFDGEVVAVRELNGELIVITTNGGYLYTSGTVGFAHMPITKWWTEE